MKLSVKLPAFSPDVRSSVQTAIKCLADHLIFGGESLSAKDQMLRVTELTNREGTGQIPISAPVVIAAHE
jgi:hypothetical protein